MSDSDPLEKLRQALPDLRILTDPADTEAFRWDETEYMRPGRPLGVCFPRSTAEVAGDRPLARGATAVPLVPRGAGTGLSGGAIAVDGALTVVMTRMNRILEIDRDNLLGDRPAGHHQRRARPGGRGAGPVLPAGPGQLRDLLHRRQPGRELRRPALREVRRDARLRAGPRGRAGRRRGHPHRWQDRQGRHGLRPDRTSSSAPRERWASSPRRPCGCCPRRRPS